MPIRAPTKSEIMTASSKKLGFEAENFTCVHVAIFWT